MGLFQRRKNLEEREREEEVKYGKGKIWAKERDTAAVIQESSHLRASPMGISAVGVLGG